jgi:poly-gamma-glutamate synthesis protein (capsule biosynthesis protein)
VDDKISPYPIPIWLNLETGQLTPSREELYPGHDSPTVVLAGDWAPTVNHLDRNGVKSGAYLGDMLPVLRGADLAIMNLECVLADDDTTRISKAGPILRRPTESITTLSSVPFQFACLANNHVFDMGEPGLRATLEALDENRIAHVGAGTSAASARQAVRLRVGSTSLTIINVAEGEEAKSLADGPGVAPLDVDHVRQQIAWEKSQSDLIFVIIHAGVERLPIPSPSIVRRFRMIAEAGADLIVGHHPHVVQGMELHQGVPIFYSLGNFVFKRGHNPRENEGILIHVGLEPGRIDSIGIVPFNIGISALGSKTGTEIRDFMTEFTLLSDLIRDGSRHAQVWAAYLDYWFDHVGLPANLQHIAIIAGAKRSAQAAVQSFAFENEGSSLPKHVIRSLMWRLFHLLDGLHPGQSPQNDSTKQAVRAKSLAVLRNQFDNSSHRELYIGAFDRLLEGKLGDSPAWARQLLSNWRVVG